MVTFMADINPSELQQMREDELDRILDTGLAAHAAVEPRAGLEDRILANLRAEQARPVGGRAWWQWGLAGAVAVVVAVGVLTWKSSRILHPVIANHPPAAMQQPSTQEANPHAAGDIAVAKHTPVRRHGQRLAHAAAAEAAVPKLDQFPSPQPLSAEEIALAQYARNFPKEAQLVAQAQEEFALEAQKEMNDVLETRLSASTQHER